MSINILLAEDDEPIRTTVKTFLLQAGYAVDACKDGEDAYNHFFEKTYQLVILDILLPKMGGQDLLQAFRQVSDVPIIMLTALSDEQSQMSSFDERADDYISLSPLEYKYFLRRIEALLRRSGALSKEIAFGKLSLFPESFKALYDGEPISLTLKEFELLTLLVQNKSRVLTHDLILLKIWGYDFEGDAGVVHTHIKNLRIKLPENIIKTIRGVGYQLEATDEK